MCDLGLELLHEITAWAPQEMRVDMEDFDGITAFAQYSTFRVGPASDKYRLEVGGYSGTAGMSKHNYFYAFL